MLVVFFTAVTSFLAVMRSQYISSVLFNSTPDDEGVSAGMVPVTGMKNARDFDFDSKTGFLYWVEYDEEKKTVSGAKI